MHVSPPVGVTPPAPRLDSEEPRQVLDEYDIPPDDGGPAAADDEPSQERPLRHVERE
jgi:hypothetical protein